MTSSGLTYDPKTGLSMIPPDNANSAVGGTSRDLNSLNGSSTPPSATTSGNGSNPYGIFVQNLKGLISQAQGTANQTPLYNQKMNVTNQSLNLSNPLNDTPYKSLYAGMSPEQSISAQNNTDNAFQPAIGSINDRIQLGNQAMQNFNQGVQNAYNVTKPVEVNAGSSLISPSGDTIYQGGRYTPTFNMNKGIMDGFDSVSGTWASDNSSKGNPYSGNTGDGNTTANSTDQIVGGVDFAGTNGAKPYASDPAYAHKIHTIYTDISKNIPNIATDPRAIDQYIQNNASSSPITGSMILDAAHTYHVDPATLTSVLNLESGFGTIGVGSRTMNPGNVGNTDDGSTTQMKSWQDGVNATAYQLQRRAVNNGGQTQANSILPGIPLPSQDSNGNYLPTSNPIVNTAIDLVEGRQVPSMVKQTTGVPSTIYNTIADKLSMAKYGVPYNPADAEAAYKVRESQPYQTYMLSAPNALRVIDQVVSHVQNLAKDHPFVVSSSGAGFLNSAAIGSLAAFGNTDAKDIQSLLAQSGDDIGKLLGTGSGSDLKIKLGGEIFNTNGSLKQTEDVASTIKQNIQDKMNDYFKAGGVAGNTTPFTTSAVNDMKQYSSVLQSAKSGTGSTPSPSGSGNFSVTAPNGKTYSFKDQASLNQFKAQAGLQ